MKTIYKYPLEITNKQSIEIPNNSRILSVANQNENICLWVEIDKKEEKKTELAFYVFGTGHDIPDNLNLHFIGTVVTLGGRLVWHVFAERQ